MKKVKSLGTTNWYSQNGLCNVEYSIGNKVSNFITTYCARWVLEISGNHFVVYIIASYFAIHLELIQNNSKYKLQFKNKIKNK